jgi:hypothetical protein
MIATTMAALLLAPQGVTVDAAKKEVKVACRIAPRKLPNLPEIYPIEVIATLPTPKGLKAHETVVTFEAAPSEVLKALESLGLKAGKPVRGEGSATGAPLEVLLDLPASGGLPARQVRVESVLAEKRTGRPLPPMLWHFTGSVMKEGKVAADLQGTLISLYPITDEVVVQSALTMREEGMVKMDTARHLLPPEGTPVTLVLRALEAATLPTAPAAAWDPEKAVLKASRAGAGGEIGVPPSGPVPVPASTSGSANPFQHRREVKVSLPDQVKPVDAK